MSFNCKVCNVERQCHTQLMSRGASKFGIDCILECQHCVTEHGREGVPTLENPNVVDNRCHMSHAPPCVTFNPSTSTNTYIPRTQLVCTGLSQIFGRRFATHTPNAKFQNLTNLPPHTVPSPSRKNQLGKNEITPFFDPPPSHTHDPSTPPPHTAFFPDAGSANARRTTCQDCV